ncbi:MAG: T9SS type A sorting domain-containing protein [Bacteroidota bacterium]
MISDDAGGVILTWLDRREDTKVFVYANRINQDGTKLWGNDDLRVGASEGAEDCPKIVSDGQHGAIFAFEDNNPPDSEFMGVYAYRVNAAGNILYRTFLFPPDGECHSFDIDSDGASGLVAVCDYGHITDQEQQLRGMRLDSAGTKIWEDETFDFGPLSIPIGKKIFGATDTGIGFPVVRYAAGVGFYFVHWDNPFGGNQESHKGYLLDLDGTHLWDPNGIILDQPSNVSPDIQSIVDQDGNLYFNYHTDADWELQKVSPNGTLPWGIGGVAYSPDFQEAPDKIVLTSCNDVIIPFDGTNSTINITRIAGDGSKVYSPDFLPLTGFTTGTQHRDPTIGINQKDQILVVWAEDPNVSDNSFDLKAHGLRKDGMLGNITSTENLQGADFKIYPNPVSGSAFLHIETAETNFGDVLLSDISGREILFQSNLDFSNGLVNLQIPATLEAGVYFLHLITKAAVRTEKILIH